jgi:hypothetical protein
MPGAVKAEERWDWTAGNPPFSQFRAFLQKAMQVADNVVFIRLASGWFVWARQEDMRQARFETYALAVCLPASTPMPRPGGGLAAFLKPGLGERQGLRARLRSRRCR